MNINFYSLWFDPTGNRTLVYHFSSRRSIHLTAYLFQPGKSSSFLSKCMGCKYARYCNKECQRKAWKDHKLECAAVQRIFPGQPVDQTRLVARLLWKRSQNRESGIKKIVEIEVIDYIIFPFSTLFVQPVLELLAISY